ncbi:glycosyltransferase family 4 protein [Dyella caseinilytica]|uniref:Glycosyltransferase family 4 protein n=1 Tax=Dyella caseinilytica TaxID=1849581 RepID=A0ABX7GYZ6_9GAMM|nr:glycosyltransferase family 4 protein [Dyella caseinilytica]QRN54395.1 glycosyltransferase family 4 protein [Dyella caseinilytica]
MSDHIRLSPDIDIGQMLDTKQSKSLRIWLPTIRSGSGADVFTLRLAEGLRNAGHEPILQWFDLGYELMPWRLKKVIAPPSIDVVHAGSWQGFAFKRQGIPLVITEHQYIAHPEFGKSRNLLQTIYHRLFAERWMRASYSCADAIVAVSEFCAEPMRRDLGRRIEVIHNWIDLEKFSPLSRDSMATISAEHTKPFKLIFIGNPSRRKGAELLPELARLLGPSFQVSCLGGLRKSFQDDRVTTNMRLLPRCAPADMPSIYQSADAVLVLSRYESFGYVALEAMASGVPVIGFNTAGTGEICLHGETALLAPLNDLQEVSRFARQLAEDPILRRRLGRDGRRRAEKYFGEPSAIDAYLDLYRRVIRDN